MTSSEPAGSAATSSGERIVDRRIAGEAGGKRGAHLRRRVAQDQRARTGGDEVGGERLAAAIVEHRRAGRQMRAHVLRDRAVVHVAMARIDVDRMLGIPEGDPVAHRLVPRPRNAAGGL